MQDHIALQALVQALKRLPGVGERSASRMAYHLLQHDRQGAQLLSQALTQAVAAVKRCLEFVARHGDALYAAPPGDTLRIDSAPDDYRPQ